MVALPRRASRTQLLVWTNFHGTECRLADFFHFPKTRLWLDHHISPLPTTFSYPENSCEVTIHTHSPSHKGPVLGYWRLGRFRDGVVPLTCGGRGSGWGLLGFSRGFLRWKGISVTYNSHPSRKFIRARYLPLLGVRKDGTASRFPGPVPCVEPSTMDTS